MSERYEPYKAIKLLYSCRSFRSGQTVSVTVYDSNGVEAQAATSMTELASTGVYMARFSPGKQDTYFAIADCVEFPKKDFKELIVGGKPGEFALGGMVPVGAKILTVKDKDVIIKEIEGVVTEVKKVRVVQGNKNVDFSKLSNTLIENNLKIENNVDDKLNKFNKEIDVTSSQNLNTLKTGMQATLQDELTKLKLHVENLHAVSFSSIKKDIAELEEKAYLGLRKTNEKYYSKISELSKDTVMGVLSTLGRDTKQIGVLADEINVSLKENNLNDSPQKLIKSIAHLTTLFDEAVLLFKNINGEKHE